MNILDEFKSQKFDARSKVYADKSGYIEVVTYNLHAKPKVEFAVFKYARLSGEVKMGSFSRLEKAIDYFKNHVICNTCGRFNETPNKKRSLTTVSKPLE